MLPAVPEITAIVEQVRAKYPKLKDIPIGEGDVEELLISDVDVDWEAIRKDVEGLVRDAVDLIPEHFMTMYQALKRSEDEPREVQGREDIPLDIRETYVKSYRFMLALFGPWEKTLDDYFKIVVERVIEFLMTNKSREIPEGWLALVSESSMMGSRCVIAMAGPLADPKEVAAKFRRKCTEVFGRDRARVSNEGVNTIEYLTLKLTGTKLKDLADAYMQRHAGAYPPDPMSSAYRAARRKVEDMLKMRIWRLQETIRRMAAE